MLIPVMSWDDVQAIKDAINDPPGAAEITALIESHEDMRRRIGALVGVIERHMFQRLQQTINPDEIDQTLWNARVIGWLDRPSTQMTRSNGGG